MLVFCYWLLDYPVYYMSLPDSGFDRVAFFYDRLARLVFGRAQEEAQLALLPFIRSGATILVIGGGSGWLLQQVLLHTQPHTIVYLEASSAMLARAKMRLKQTEPAFYSMVDFRLGTEASLTAADHFDVIITPFLLDLFPPDRLSKLMKKLQGVLAPKGLWLFTDFWPSRQPAPLWQRFMIGSMYVFFRITSGVKAKKLPDFRYHFQELKLQEIFSTSFYQGMIQAKVYQRH